MHARAPLPALLAGSGLVGDAKLFPRCYFGPTRGRSMYNKSTIYCTKTQKATPNFLQSSVLQLPGVSILSASTSYSAPASMSEASAKAQAAATSLIGHFHLGPNRVEDMIIEALELNVPCYAAYCRSFACFCKDRLCHILGRKFHVHQISLNVEETSRMLTMIAKPSQC